MSGASFVSGKMLPLWEIHTTASWIEAIHSFLILKSCCWIVSVDRDSNVGQISRIFSLVTIFREQHLEMKASQRFHLLFPALVPWLFQKRFFCKCSETRSWFYTKRHNYLSQNVLKSNVLNLIFMFTPLFFSIQVTRPVEIAFSLLNVSYPREIVCMG